MKNISKANWKKVDNLSDEELDYTDSPEVTEEMFKNMKLRNPIKTIARSILSLDEADKV